MTDTLLDRIEINPEVCGGRPVFLGTRITVASILEYLMVGDTHEEILDNFPQLTAEDIKAAYAWSIALSDRERSIVPLKKFSY
jgi:uncharacterized protein (DUF433 family)